MKTLAQELNDREAQPETYRGKVLRFFRYDEAGDEQEVVLPFEWTGWVDEHEEGADRGGWVPWVARVVDGEEEVAYLHYEEWVS